MDIEAFVRHWSDREGGAERANAASYLIQLTQVLDLPTPDPASADTATNDYVFERAVRSSHEDGIGYRRIDLYRRNCFILEAKQSRVQGRKADPFDADDRLLFDPPTGAGWDTRMRNARNQAMHYVALLPPDHAAPPFVIICDLGRAFEVWADFSGTGRGYAPFPDRRGYRFSHHDLLLPEIQTRLRAIWLDPHSLDPTRIAAVATREIADELAVISRRLERRGVPPEQAAHFLMRCIFTLFAGDVGLLPKLHLRRMLDDCVASPAAFAPMIEDLWRRLDDPSHERRFFSGFGLHVPHINGGLFVEARAFDLRAEEIRRLAAASRRNWSQVEPAIFGALLEHALAPADRRRLGAHYTPRRYVERLVELTVMEPLRADWRRALTQAEAARDEDDRTGAVRLVRAFHSRLCGTRVLDPACGTGNFLYVALEMMKTLEGEVLETLTDLGESGHLGLVTVDPHQFLGLEVNPRAAAIADLVLWIGFLQQHYRHNSGHPSEPILRAHGNIRWCDALIDWDGAPNAVFARDEAGGVQQVWPNARPTRWPDADFVVGNPPFIGGKDLRSRLEPGYAQTLWRLYPRMNDSADIVMYWWDKAAQMLTRPGSDLRRFGLVTTNSITQVFQRRVVERWVNGQGGVGLVYAVPDHPWTRANRDSASVRIAMTVAEVAAVEGVRLAVISEADIDTDEPRILLGSTSGRINADLSVGVDVTATRPLRAAAGLCSPGVKLHGAGFIVGPAQAAAIGLGRRPGLEAHVRPYLNGRDLMARSRQAWVIDFHGLDAAQVRRDFPEAYQHLVETVKEARDAQGRPIGRDINPRATYRDRWWVFGEPRGDFRPALAGLGRFIVTAETAKHRVFQFVDGAVIPDNMLVCVADDDAATLAVLSSRAHLAWCAASGGRLEDRPRYTKSRCFDPFPFPSGDQAATDRLRALGETLDAHRKTVLEQHADLTLTGLYNLLDSVRSGAALDTWEQDVRSRGLVLILRDIHREIDALTSAAYGWEDDVTDADMVARLAALNHVRLREEAEGRIRWLRPAYQSVQLGSRAESTTGDLALPTPTMRRAPRRRFPIDRYEQPLAIQAELTAAGAPMAPLDLAGRFQGGRAGLAPRIDRVLATLHRYGHVERLADGRWTAAR